MTKTLTTLVIVLLRLISHTTVKTYEGGNVANYRGLIVMNLSPISSNFLSSIKMYAWNLTHAAQILIWQVPLATVFIFISMKWRKKSEIKPANLQLWMKHSTMFTQNSVERGYLMTRIKLCIIFMYYRTHVIDAGFFIVYCFDTPKGKFVKGSRYLHYYKL